MDDLKMFTKVINGAAEAGFDGGFVPVPWRNVEFVQRKLTIVILEWDGVCMPHPPVLRAIREPAEKLKGEGHEGIPCSFLSPSILILTATSDPHQTPI
jgi:amidase